MGICRLYVGSVATICMLSVNAIPARFRPSWAEAHERTLASLNNGRPPYSVHWKGCITLKRGTQVDIVDQDEGFLTEIVTKGRHWFADE